MATIMLIAGMWQGGWCWSRVTRILRQRGHSVIAPTLLGVGSRPGELRSDIDLTTHVNQVAARLKRCGQRVVACGHSYGGTVLLHAAHPDQVGSLVMLDSNLPASGRSILDQYPDDMRLSVLDRIVPVDGVPALPPRHPNDLGVKGRAAVARFSRLMRPQPAAALLERRALADDWTRVPLRVLVTAEQGPRGHRISELAQIAQASGMEHVIMQGGHQLMHSAAAEVADLLHQCALRTANI